MILQLKNPMSSEQLNELKTVIQHATHGNYVPLLIIAGVVVFCFAIVVLVLVNQYKSHLRRTDEVEKLTIQNAKLIAVHDADIRNVKERISA